MVDKLVRRSLKKDKFTFLAINIVFLISIIFAVISVFALQYGLNNYNHYLSETNTEDFQTTTIVPLTDKQQEEIMDEYDLLLEKKLIYKYNYENQEQNEVELKISPYDEDTQITSPHLTSGKMPEQQDEIVLSREFAELNQLDIGDKYDINGMQFKISGLASFPELMYPMKDGSLLPDNKTIGSALVTPSAFNDIANENDQQIVYLGKFNQTMTTADRKEVYYQMQNDNTLKVPKVNIVNEANGSGETMEVPTFTYILDRTENLNLNVLELEYCFLGIIVAGLSLVIGIITVVLAIFLFKNIVENQRREIGIMQAEGISTFEITKAYQKYFAYSLIITSIIGLGLGTLSVIGMEYLFKMFFNIIHYPPQPMLFIMTLCLVAIIVILVMIAVQIFAVQRNINQPILDLVSNVKKSENPKNLKPKKNKHNLSFKRRMQINTVTRNLGKSLLLVYGILFSAFLLVFGLLMSQAVVNMEDNIKGDNFTYDYTVNFSPGFTTNPQLNDENTLININGELLKINNEAAEFQNITIMGYDNQNQYIDFELASNLSGNEVVVSQNFADLYQVDSGDTLTIGNKLNKSEQYQFKIVGIVDVYHEAMVYGSKSGIQEMLNLPNSYYNGLVGAGQTKEIVTQGDKQALYYSIDDLIAGMNSYSQIMNFMIIYISALAGILAFIALSIISNIIIRSNKKTISIMKVLGYSAKEINKMLLSGYKWIVIITTIVAIPLAVEGCKLYIDFILGLVPDMNYPIYIEASIVDYIIVFGIIMLIYLLSAKLAIRKINKIKLSESLKIDE